MTTSSGEDLEAVASAIRTRQDLVAWLALLRDDLRRNPDEWENDTLPRFLEALAAWTSDMEGAFTNQGQSIPESPTWNLIATMLLAARIYE